MSGAARRAIVVLGMHRSGTSAVTRLLALAGGAPPREVMPPTADNPQGYWESPKIARFNNRLLESAGTRWNDDATIAPAWFSSAARREDLALATDILAEEFPATDRLVVKDPRICRLLPFWLEVFAAAGIEPYGLVVAREPLEVARSLAARAAVPDFRLAAIQATSRGLLLWLRYVLDSERQSRGMPRLVVRYDEVVADWRRSFAGLFASGILPAPDDDTAASIDAFLDPSLRRQRSSEPLPAGLSPESVGVLRGLLATLHEDTRDRRLFRDRLSEAFDWLLLAYAPIRRDHDLLAEADPWSERILDGLAAAVRRPASPPPVRPSVLFLSAADRSIGHVYRVEHAAAALGAAGWTTHILPLDDPAANARIAQVGMVVVFRGRWGGALAAVRAGCTARGIPLVYDVDDLLFDPSVTAAGWIAFLDGLPVADRERWIREADDYRRAVERSDAVVLTTGPLAAAAGRLCSRCHVLPNALDRWMVPAAAAAVSRPRRSTVDGRPRLVFASGTPTHHRDFAVAAEAVARVFARRPEPELVIVGHLDPAIYPELAPFADRVDRRPPVPLLELFGELAACDINLCPLEPGNPFCESKSAVRWLAAAAVGVPGIVSSTGPLRDAVIDGVSGLVAADVSAWEAAIESLLDRPALAAAIGQAGRVDAWARFGFDAWAPRVVDVYASILEQFIPGRPGAIPT